MTPSPADRQLVRAARERLDGWVANARADAYDDLFDGPDARLTDAELALTDRVDSELSRRDEGGLWGADRYGVLAHTAIEAADGPLVVCTYHPQLPEGYGGPDGLDDETEERINAALWDYCERVAELAQGDLEGFVDEAGAG
ncbi:MAG: hypothetical protein ABEJ31_13580 [Haloarculaceae archaeon]